MIILIPMGGFGSRFRDAGYIQNKPCIPTFDRHSNQEVPMIVAAMKDIPCIFEANTKIICVNRDFHATDGTESAILDLFPQTVFIHDHVLLDQAFACLLAREFLASDDELIIAACDNGLDFDKEAFLAKRTGSDVLMVSHQGDENIVRNPHAHSWAELAKDGETLRRISIKQTVSDDYMNDHATTGMFWFNHASDFLNGLEAMLSSGKGLTERHVVDGVLEYNIEAGLRVSFFDVRYICWGTPEDFENYQATCGYWKEYIDANPWL
jgi:dTDP-glucose pyrophosphorylase